MRLPATLPPESLTVIVDTREQCPLDLSPLLTERGTLTTGDYSVKGLERVVAIERKSLGDLISCVGRERARFDREVDRLLAYPVRCLVVESTWAAMELGDWRGKITPRQVEGSVIGWMARGLPIAMVGSHARAGKFVSSILYTAARRRYQEARIFVSGLAGSAENGYRESPRINAEASP